MSKQSMRNKSISKKSHLVDPDAHFCLWTSFTAHAKWIQSPILKQIWNIFEFMTVFEFTEGYNIFKLWSWFFSSVWGGCCQRDIGIFHRYLANQSCSEFHILAHFRTQWLPSGQGKSWDGEISLSGLWSLQNPGLIFTVAKLHGPLPFAILVQKSLYFLVSASFFPPLVAATAV